MQRIKRTMAVLGVVVVLGVPALATAGCGSSGHYLGAVVAHKVVNHFAKSAAAQRRVNKVFCLYHGHRVIADVRNHHYFIAGLNALAAYHACKAGFGRQK